jgi:hypothetical protein
MRHRRAVSWSIALLAAMAPISASANGRFPSASQLALDPKDPSHLVLAATFGILESSDAGKTWGWICEGVVGYSSTEDPAIAVTANGTVYVADSYNHRIRKITSAGVVTTLAGNGAAAFADGIGTSAFFNYPRSVAVDASGTVYVADQNNHRIRIIQ